MTTKKCFTVIETEIFNNSGPRQLASDLHYRFPIFISEEKADEHIKEAREYFKDEPNNYPGYRKVEITLRSLS